LILVIATVACRGGPLGPAPPAGSDTVDSGLSVPPTPADPDPDGDGLDLDAERAAGTDPHDPDSDDDGLLDGFEVARGTDPLDPRSHVEPIPPPRDPCPPGAPAPDPGERPNVLWIVSEDNGPALGAYGDPVARTPALDRLATQGVRFDNAVAPFPVCSPTRFSIFTGIHAAVAAGSQDMRSLVQDALPDSVRGWPEHLREAGYYTSNNQKTDYNHAVGDRIETAWDANGGSATFRDRPDGAPFFAVFNLFGSHESALHDPDRPLVTDPDRVVLPPQHPDLPEIRRDWARYHDAVARMDERVAEILGLLRDDGLDDDTIVFYFSDHGGAVPGSKRLVYDGGVRVPLIVRVPERYCHLLPAPAGAATDRLVSLEDLGPTVLTLAGVPLRPHFTGRPFLGIDHADQRDFVVVARRRMDEQLDVVRSIRTRSWQLVRNFQPFRPALSHIEYLWRAESAPAWEAAFRSGGLSPVEAARWEPRPGRELFDLQRDPHETTSRHDDAELAPIRDKLDALLGAWMLEHRDTAFAPESMPEGVTFANRDDAAAYPLTRLRDVAIAGSDRDASRLAELIGALSDPHPAVRFWAATALTSLGPDAASARPQLEDALHDAEPLVRIAAAEALLAQGVAEPARATLEERLLDAADNPMQKLYAGQAYVTFADQLTATPDAVFEASMDQDDGPFTTFVDFRLRYLLDR